MLEFFRSLAAEIAAVVSGVVLLFTGSPTASPQPAPPSQPRDPAAGVPVQNAVLQAAAEINRAAAVQSGRTTNSQFVNSPPPSKPIASPTSASNPSTIRDIANTGTRPAAPAPTNALTDATLTARLSALANDLRLELAQKLAAIPRSTGGGGGGSSAPLAVTSNSNYVTKDFLNYQVGAIADSVRSSTPDPVELTDATIPDDITASNYLPLSGGTLTGALSVGGILSTGTLCLDGDCRTAWPGAGGALVGPYFTATSTTATSTFAGALDVAGIVNLATTTITGGLTVNGNTNITEGGELTVGDKIISPGEIGLGTTTPAAKLAIQSTDANQTSLLIVGTTSQSNPLLDIFNSSNANLLRLTADGKLGIGTSTPAARLHVTDQHSSPLTWTPTAGTTAIFDNTNASRSFITIVGRSTGQSEVWFGDENFENAGRVRYDHITDSMSFNAGISEKMRILSNGNVGIGTTSPASKLDVWGDLRVGTSSVPTLFAQSSTGRVGIGTSTPTHPLSVIGNTDTQAVGPLVISSTGGANVGTAITLDATDNVGGRKYSFISTGATAGPGAGAFAVYDGSPGIDRYTLLIDNSGRMGIGDGPIATTPFLGLFTIDGSSVRDPYINFRTSGVSRGFVGVSRGPNTIFTGDVLGDTGIRSESNLLLGSGGGNIRMYIASGGNIGVGTTTPASKLTVDGTVSFDGLTASTGAGSLCLSAANEVVFNSGTDACLSSLRSTKHAIDPLTLDALGQVLALQPVSFVYNEGDGRIRYGFIAEDTAQVDEHLATYDAEGNLSGIDDRAVLSIVVKAIKELAGKVGDMAHLVVETIQAQVGNFTRLDTDTLNTRELCTTKSDGIQVCVTGDQLAAMLAGAGGSQSPTAQTPSESTPSIPPTSTTTPPLTDATATTTATTTATSTAVATSSPLQAKRDNDRSETGGAVSPAPVELQPVNDNSLPTPAPHAANDNETLSEELPATGTD